MTHRDVVLDAVNFRAPAYVPWAWSMTEGAADNLSKFLGQKDLTGFVDSHDVSTVAHYGDWTEVTPGHWRDPLGVVWDRSVDPDIGTPCDWPIRQPSDLAKFKFPDANRPECYARLRDFVQHQKDRLRVFDFSFSLFERAWTLRGMENLLMDMVERPEFVDDLLDAICEFNLTQIRNALKYDIDIVCFGDDYGMQQGLIMGITHWRRFIKPRLARMWGTVRAAGKQVELHSCGQVEPLFDDMIEIGLNLFNPFQPEVTNVFEVLKKYHGRLAFHGGLSTQRTLPYGSPADVREDTRKLIEAGREGGLIIAPAHSVPRDVPPKNLVAMAETLKAQAGYTE